MKFEPRLPEEGINVSRGHPLADAAKLAAAVAGIVILAVAAFAFTADRLVTLVPPEVEVRALGRLWPDVRSSMSPERIAIADRVQPIVQRLAAHLDVRLEPQVLVVENAVPNAFALPGGVIGVTSGLLGVVRSENELAFVLGHELGHFANRDHLRKLGRSLAISLLLAWIGGGSVDASADQLTAAVAEVTSLAFDRRQEAAADAVGLELLHAAYGHVGGANDFFDRVEGSVSGGRRWTVYFETHPAGTARTEAIRTLSRRRGWNLEGPFRPFVLDSTERGS